MPLRVLGSLGGSDYDIEQAVRYAAGLENDSGTRPEKPADVINLSLGGLAVNTLPPIAFQLARQAGVIIVAAAGNDASSQLNYPASLDGVVSVSAVDINAQLTPYSNTGATIDIAAPGGDNSSDGNNDNYADGVLSSSADDSTGDIEFVYTFYQGTSMAAPHVSGVAALMRSVNPQLTPDIFDELLASGLLTNDIGPTGRDDRYGYGLLNAQLAVQTAASLSDNLTDTPTPQISIAPSTLNFSHNRISLAISVTNDGSENLLLQSIDEELSNWVSINSSNVNPQGFGTYTVVVDRNGLPEDTYVTEIVFETNQSKYSIPISMQIINDVSYHHAGLQYITLVDKLNSRVVKSLLVEPNNSGNYNFQFLDVSPGLYSIFSGSDINGDGNTCGNTEACSTFPNTSSTAPIVVNNTSIDNLTFNTGFEIPD